MNLIYQSTGVSLNGTYHHISAFAPPPAALDQHIVPSSPGYTTDLVAGQVYETAAGGLIGVTAEGEKYFVNGVRIVKSNAMMTNGVFIM